ncbi:mandelate racemase [Reyranella soli]|uniref:Mandelate racemase n=1 Tax=Reyranella soli TaxID=1230389 RepID=A0A512NAT2_9HYPH|nr:mandelate racemase [Reyranella soli]GEP56056.1 mandelate racemase [Reyranella soli]
MKVKLDEVERYERHVKMRLAFRFGVITVTDATQAVIRARITLPDGRSSHGVAAEALAAKWFEKSPQFTDEQNLDQLRQALDLAIELYRARGLDTPFGLFAGTYLEQQKRGAAQGLNPLVAAYGPALLDRAILDALGKATGQSFAEMITRNAPGIVATALTPDIEELEIEPFLAKLTPGKSIDVRHTVGLVDPLTAADRPAAERVNDGLPETLEEVVSYYRGRYYKLKVGGDIKADLDRLGRIAAVLDAGAGDYLATLDGNEQYDNVEGIVELWRKVIETPGLAKLAKATLFIEQPIKRAVALSRSVGPLAQLRPVIIDESDGELSSFPSALRLGYSGVSSKNCKGFYKSILNALRVAHLGAGHFMSAEDLTTWPGVSVQQDLALVSLLGLTHVERNAHHFIDGMAFAPEREQLAFVAAHPELYEKKDGRPARLKATGGTLALRSLNVPGFAVGAEMDFKSMTPMTEGAST